MGGGVDAVRLRRRFGLVVAAGVRFGWQSWPVIEQSYEWEQEAKNVSPAAQWGQSGPECASRLSPSWWWRYSSMGTIGQS